MDFQFLILLLASLACPIGMGVVMWWMYKSMSHHSVSEPSSHLSSGATDNLLEGNQALEARVAELEQRLAAQQEVE